MASETVVRRRVLPLPSWLPSGTDAPRTKGSSLTRLPHRLVELKNGFKAVVISHPEVQQSAASMYIGVGASADPNAEDGLLGVEEGLLEEAKANRKAKDLPGLAHFCEHMLFLGTDKYPVENEFHSFIQTHSGHHNATTSFEGTNYFFDVATEHLQGALDRFGQFFIGPRFTESATEREMNAVHQEHSRNILLDANRMLAVLKDCARVGHPFRRFTTGNIDTLKHLPEANVINVREELMNFHRRFYYPENMTLAVIGRESLDQLEEWVVTLFSEMKDRRTEEDREFTSAKKDKIESLKKVLSPFDNWTPPYSQSTLPMRITYLPVKHLRSVRLIWQIPSSIFRYKEKPSRYLSHLLGHEGPGSVLYTLKKKGLANGLSAGALYETLEFCLWNLNIDLTEEGLKRIGEVKSVVFEYIQRIKEAGLPEWVFDEIKRMGEISFRFREEEQPRDYVQTLSKSLQIYAEEDVLSGPYIIQEFNRDLTQQILDQLTPENLIEQVTTQDIAGKTTRTVKYFSAEYLFESTKDENLPLFTDGAAIYLPDKNPYIPSRFDLLPSDDEIKAQKHPKLVKETELLKLWHKQDVTYAKPKAELYFLLRTPMVYHSPYWEVISHFFFDLCEDEMQSSLYDATISGLDFSVRVSLDGIVIHVRGFDEKLPLLLQNVLKNIFSARFDPNRFNDLKEKRKRMYLSWPQAQPWSIMKEEVPSVLYDCRWTVEEKLAALLPTTLPEVQSIISNLFTSYNIEAFIQGNISAADAVQMVDGITAHLPAPKSQYPLSLHHRRVISLAPGSNYLRSLSAKNPKEQNSGIITYYQVENHSIRLAALNDLWSEMASEPVFSNLRTKEQLGYIVWRQAIKTERILGYKITIQSSVAGPHHLEERIEHFLTSFREKVEQCTEEHFDTIRKSVITKLEQKPVNLVEEASWNWHFIDNYDGRFDIQEKEVEALKELKKEDLLHFIDRYILPSATRKKLSIHFHGNQHPLDPTAPPPTGFTPIVDVSKWKLFQTLFPVKTHDS